MLIQKTLLTLAILLLLFAVAPVTSAQPRINIARAPAPLFDDPELHGATDPFVIWNPVKKKWFMYYTQRRASMRDTNGVNWVHGSKIGIATSKDGRNWTYLGIGRQ